ncbi:hypothetical protein BFP97_03385 [Roseivirga sp. 4D4]|uniref:hypothetical protein n=1 Tax=Roseivirga sp. 4D4 TaxID=1889784 RepID=UPI0008538B27|nr:hypothetical protein [Roseivirga sp. 4D4]OEK00604.1 hypothetical protein BFP97_03385 [Roseivirga sp. 4D4]
MSNNSEKEKDKYFPLFLKIAIGFLILAFVFPFIVNGFFSDWSKSGTFGDTFGALNAVFSGLALAGVIVTILIQRTELKNQRVELSLQRDEMKETRKEFLLNRTTTLVYNQLDRFEKALTDFRINTPNGTNLQGNDAIVFLDDNKQTVYKPLGKTEEEYAAEMKTAIIELLKIYTPNQSEIDKLAHSTYTSVEVLKRLIYKTDLGIEHLNDLKNLFFVNIGFINMGVIERISEVAKSQFEYLKAEDYVENNLDVGTIIHANIFLESIKDFYQLRLTEENFGEHKSKWIENNGNLEN